MDFLKFSFHHRGQGRGNWGVRFREIIWAITPHMTCIQASTLKTPSVFVQEAAFLFSEWQKSATGFVVVINWK